MIGAWGVIPATIGFAVLTLVVLSVHLLVAEAVIGYKSAGRFSTLARVWLGPAASGATGIAQTLQVFGSNLAYLILGGEFLAVIASLIGIHIPLLVWQILFWIAGMLIVLVGLSGMARIEAFLTWILIAVMLLIIGSLLGRMDFNLITFIPTGWTFEPYGVFLFSLFGMTIIPELEEVVQGRPEDLRKAVVRGTLVAALLTYAFGLSAWLASSGSLGRDPADIVRMLPPVLALAVPVFGLLAVITSYITTAFDLGTMFHTDYHFNKGIAWLVALGTPLALLFLTTRDFLSTIGLVGSLFSATVAIFCVLMGRAALRKARRSRFGEWRWWWQEAIPLSIVFLLIAGGVSWLVV